mgnify:CR=1 FL=1
MEAALCGCEGVKNTGQELCLYQRRFQQITGRMFGDMERACSTNDVNGNFMREMKRAASMIPLHLPQPEKVLFSEMQMFRI